MGQKVTQKVAKKGQKWPFLTVLVPYFGPLLSEGGTARPIKLTKTGQKVDLGCHFGTPKMTLFGVFLDPIFGPFWDPFFDP